MARRRECLSDFADPGALLCFLHGPVGVPADKNEVLRALVLEAQCGENHTEVCTVLVLLALWPGLDAVRKRLLRSFRDDPGFLVGELTGRLSQAVLSARLDQVNWIAATFLRNIERDLKRDLVRQAREINGLDLEDYTQIAAQPVFRGKGILQALRREIGPDAELVVAVAVFGFSQKEAARALGISHDTARKRYQRAIHRLTEKIDWSEH